MDSIIYNKIKKMIVSLENEVSMKDNVKTYTDFKNKELLYPVVNDTIEISTNNMDGITLIDLHSFNLIRNISFDYKQSSFVNALLVDMRTNRKFNNNNNVLQKNRIAINFIVKNHGKIAFIKEYIINSNISVRTSSAIEPGEYKNLPLSIAINSIDYSSRNKGFIWTMNYGSVYECYPVYVNDLEILASFNIEPGTPVYSDVTIENIRFNPNVDLAPMFKIMADGTKAV